MSGDVNTLQSSSFEFSCQVSAVYLICFGGYLFIDPGDISGIDHQYIPAGSRERMINVVPATTAFITTLNLVLGEMPGNITG
jgi:hypothetical protein